MQYYTVDIAGLKRDLMRCPISDKLDIAAFILFGDVEITVHSATELIKRLPEFDFIVTPEAKSIPLAYEMARQSGKKYFVVRKKAKLYMKDPVSVSVRSITTDAEQTLILDGIEGEQIRGKRVVIFGIAIGRGVTNNMYRRDMHRRVFGLIHKLLQLGHLLRILRE